jgi:hypothetical protein
MNDELDGRYSFSSSLLGVCAVSTDPELRHDDDGRRRERKRFALWSVPASLLFISTPLILNPSPRVIHTICAAAVSRHAATGAPNAERDGDVAFASRELRYETADSSQPHMCRWLVGWFVASFPSFRT